MRLTFGMNDYGKDDCKAEATPDPEINSKNFMSDHFEDIHIFSCLTRMMTRMTARLHGTLVEPSK